MSVGLLKANGNTKIYRLVETVGAAATELYKLPLDPGLYALWLLIRANVTGTTTAVGPFHPFVDEQQVSIGDASYRLVDLNGSAFEVNNQVVLPAGASTRVRNFVHMVTGTGVSMGFAAAPMPWGLRLSVTKGTATTGQQLEVDIAACRLDSA